MLTHMATTTPNKTDKPTVAINVTLPADLHRRLRVRCINDGIQLKEAVTEALTLWLKR